MDAGIADTINRHAAAKIAAHLDNVDLAMPAHLTPEIRWQNSAMADTVMGTNDATDGDRAWLVGMFATRTPELDAERIPADCDWENLFSHIRAEILARRDPEAHAHSVRAAETPARDGVGSR